MNLSLASLTLVSVLLSQSGPASRPVSQPARVGGQITDIYGEVTVIYELGEGTLRAKESWRFRNEGAFRLDPKVFSLSLPKDLKRARLDEDSAPFQLNETEITLSAGLGPGEHNLGLTYEIPLSSGSNTTTRRFPFRVGGARVIMENTPGLEVSSSIAASKRIRDLNGIVFAIWDLQAFAPGQAMEIDISGLPSRDTWMRTLTIIASILVLIWMVIALRSESPSQEAIQAQAPKSVMSAGARKTRLLQALELLEQDLEEASLDQKQYERRQKALLKELASTMRQQELEQGTSV